MSAKIEEGILRSLNEQVYIKNKEMERMVAHVAHELLTPITSLLLTADNLLDHFEEIQEGKQGFYKVEEIIEFLERIARNGTDLKTQAIHILEHFSNTGETKSTVVDIVKLTKMAIDDISLKCKKENIQLQFESVLSSAEIVASPEVIKTILRNLLSNAVKFTIANKKATHKSITVHMTHSGESIDIQITDSGIGMPMEFFSSRIYEFGSRSDNAISQEVRGYGLGLTTVKQLLDSLGGSIRFSSQLDEGTTAYVSFPIHDNDEIVI